MCVGVGFEFLANGRFVGSTHDMHTVYNMAAALKVYGMAGQ